MKITVSVKWEVNGQEFQKTAEVEEPGLLCHPGRYVPRSVHKESEDRNEALTRTAIALFDSIKKSNDQNPLQ